MSNNKVVIGGDISAVAFRADNEERRADIAVRELSQFKRHINAFFSAITEVRFPANAPAWAPEWYEWLLTGEIPLAPEVAPPLATEDLLPREEGTDPVGDPDFAFVEESDVVLETEVGLIVEEPEAFGGDSLLLNTDPAKQDS